MLHAHAPNSLHRFVTGPTCDGGNSLEMARCRRRNALLRSASARRATSQCARVQHFQRTAGQQFQCEFVRHYATSRCRLHECRDLETGQRRDDCEYRGPGRRWSEGRARIEIGRSFGVVPGWSVGSRFSAAGQRLRIERRATRRSQLAAGGGGLARQASQIQRRRPVPCLSTIGSESKSTSLSRVRFYSQSLTGCTALICLSLRSAAAGNAFPW